MSDYNEVAINIKRNMFVFFDKYVRFFILGSTLPNIASVIAGTVALKTENYDSPLLWLVIISYIYHIILMLVLKMLRQEEICLDAPQEGNKTYNPFIQFLLNFGLIITLLSLLMNVSMLVVLGIKAIVLAFPSLTYE